MGGEGRERCVPVVGGVQEAHVVIWVEDEGRRTGREGSERREGGDQVGERGEIGAVESDAGRETNEGSISSDSRQNSHFTSSKR